MSMLRRCCTACCDCLVLQSDSPIDANIKRGMAPVIYVVAPLVSFLVFPLVPAVSTACIGILVAFFIFCVAGRIGVGMLPVLQANILMISVSIALFDIFDAGQLVPRTWNCIVMVLDACLVFDCHKLAPFVMAFIIVYIAVERAESVSRIGLYEWASSSSAIPKVCDCSDPPCGNELVSAGTQWLTMSLVILVDFHFTRNFATDLRHQLLRVNASVDVAARVTSALARYDVEGAEGVIIDGENLPDQLAESFLKLVSNLRSYKAYLPHSCLVPPEAEGNASADEPAGIVVEAPEGGAWSASPVGPALELPPPSHRHAAHLAPKDELLLGHRLSHHRLSHRSSAASKCTEATDVSGSSRGSRHSEFLMHLEPLDLKARVRRARVSLAASNMLQYLSSAGDLGGASNTEWISNDVEGWCRAVSHGKGVVDLIGGDRRYASFNARSACSDHASVAIGALHSRGQGSWSGSVVTGLAVCGDFGSASAMRFMVQGGVSSSLHTFERLAAHWNIEALADENAYSASCYTWEGELLAAVFMDKRGVKPMRTYNMITRREGGRASEAEWMYQLNAIGESQYAEANKAKEVIIKEKLDSLSVPRVESSVRDDLKEDSVMVWRAKEVGL
eukprot:Hpha_TRINITY_DN15959_c3_g1::TRINITY_DN15959_c3_g1_i1::g.70627::m.70627